MLTNEQIANGNRLIAEFMGFIKSFDNHYQCCFGKINRILLPQYMEFQSNWNWIMPVVKRIHDTIEIKTISECSEREWQVSTYLTRMCITADIETVWNACVLYIEWYDQNKK